ncbi:hypothetical protein IQ05_00985 [Flavobacterium tiangeerense]|uniref:Lipoprotein n=1 Tax=Flavobacterium tiangeerense TaxID=459471 RepID=A0ABY3FLT8_9FLAO|nr:hypothetical protein [Flavobacterium tiangeerense]TWI01404.1 hypothetical protein IQ05_00985 [Flavobacterium tiangeerense]
MTKKLLFLLTILTYFACGNLAYGNNTNKVSNNFKNYKVEHAKSYSFSDLNEIENDFEFISFDIEEDVEFGDDLEKYTNSISSNFGLFSYSKNQKIYNKTLFCILQKSIPLYDLFCNWKLNLS